MKTKHLLVFLVIIGLLILAVVFNPTKEQHMETIQTKVAERLEDRSKIYEYGAKLGLKAIKTQVKYHDYFVGSTITYDNQIYSVGALGVVVIVNKIEL